MIPNYVQSYLEYLWRFEKIVRSAPSYQIIDPILNCCIPWGYLLNNCPQNTKSFKKKCKKKKTCPTDFQDVRIDFVPTVTVPGPSFLEKSALALRSTESREHRGAGMEHLVRNWRFHQPPPKKKQPKSSKIGRFSKKNGGLTDNRRLDLKSIYPKFTASGPYPLGRNAQLALLP